jgi:four helix bundle protein
MIPAFANREIASGMQDFRHIKAWQRAHALATAIHKLSRRFTGGGYARLRAQLTGAADSIGDNIVEGCGASTKEDFARFLDNSIKSANETEGHLLKARDLGLISLSEWEKYSAETIEVRKMIFGYCGKVRASAAKGDKSADK